MSELRPTLYECLYVYKGRIIFLVVINLFIILFGQELCFYNNGLTGSTNTQIFVKLLLNDDVVGLITLGRVNP